MVLQTATVVDIGTTYEKNDDRALVGGVIYDEQTETQELTLPALAVVCDGVGGNAGGGMAAELALRAMMTMPVTEETGVSHVESALRLANEAILAGQQQEPSLCKMCTTVAGVLFLTERTILFHSGDSRVYRYDGRYLTRMTKDHSPVQEMVDMGVLTEEEAAVHPDRNRISRCLGSPASLPPDIYESEVGIRPGDVYLICSDGLWESVTNAQVTKLLEMEELSLLEKAELLTELAKRQGSTDNITVCLCAAPPAQEQKQENQPFVLD